MLTSVQITKTLNDVHGSTINIIEFCCIVIDEK